MMHGTSCAYSKYRCRCITCREAHRVRMRDYHARSKQTDYKPKSKGPKNRITDEEVERVWNKLKGRTTPDDRWGRSPLEDM